MSNRPPPLRGVPLIALVAGSIGALIISAYWASLFGSAWWLLVGPLAIAVNVAFIWSFRRRAVTDHEPDHTGLTVAPAPTTMTRPLPASWTGGANMAGALGRMNATWPLAVLEVTAERLTLRVRPGPIGAIFGMKPVVTNRTSVQNIFPVRGWMGSGGVGILVQGEPVAYFWTTDRDGVLVSLYYGGYTVTWQELRARIW